jgi:hypothetical protein
MKDECGGHRAEQRIPLSNARDSIPPGDRAGRYTPTNPINGKRGTMDEARTEQDRQVHHDDGPRSEGDEACRSNQDNPEQALRSDTDK